MTDIEPYKKKELDSEGEEARVISFGSILHFPGKHSTPGEEFIENLVVGAIPFAGSIYTALDGSYKSSFKGEDKIYCISESAQKGRALGIATIPIIVYLASGSFPLAFGCALLNYGMDKTGEALAYYLEHISRSNKIAEQETIETKLLAEES